MEEIELRARCPQCEALNLLVIGAAAASKISCSRCGAVLLDYEPVRGYVYVLSNDHMPGLVKVGFTTRAVEERVAELNSGTAVPAPFVIEAVFPSGDPERHEQEVHDRLASTRLPGREFFRTTLPETLQAVAQVCGGPPKYARDASLLADQWPPCPTPPGVEPANLPPASESSNAIRPPIPQKESRTPEEKTERLRKWQEKMYQR
jgi:hypothetical protein